MLQDAMSYCDMLCHAVLCYVMLCCVMLCINVSDSVTTQQVSSPASDIRPSLMGYGEL